MLLACSKLAPPPPPPPPPRGGHGRHPKGLSFCMTCEKMPREAKTIEELAASLRCLILQQDGPRRPAPRAAGPIGRYPLRRCRCPLPDVGYPALFISAPAPKVFSGCADCMPLGGTSVASLCALCAGRVRRLFRHWSLLCVVLECTCM